MTFTPHATQRFYERTNGETSKKLIQKAIDSKNYISVKRLSGTRTLVYVPIDESIYKVVLQRKIKKIITFLPWHSEFKFEIEFCHVKWQKQFKVVLFPDCYLEIKNPHILTEMHVIHPDNAKEYITYDNPIFDGAFELAWEIYNQRRQYV
jgi:hypothetical protein